MARSLHTADMRTTDFDYELPQELIAQQPARERDQSRLLVLRRDSGEISHQRFRDLPEYLRAGDLLVLNDSRVIPARLRGVNVGTGGRFEILLLEEPAPNEWWAMLRPGKRARVGTRIEVLRRDKRASGIYASVIATNSEGHRLLRFGGFQQIAVDPEHGAAPLPCRSGSQESALSRDAARGDSAAAGAGLTPTLLAELGEVPLPPYIERNASGSSEQDRERYQTVYARVAGSVAAPTAGLHFTEPLMAGIRSLGVEIAFVTLHVGLATFAPVKTENIAAHPMHEERYELSQETAAKIRATRRRGGRVIAVGTTTVRVLESLAAGPGPFPCPASGRTRMFIYPPFEFKAVDGLVTNFHLPRSTLLMLVSAFAAQRSDRGAGSVLTFSAGMEGEVAEKGAGLTPTPFAAQRSDRGAGSVLTFSARREGEVAEKGAGLTPMPFAAPKSVRGRETVLAAYREAIRQRYRFFSYGDAMLIL